MKLDLIKYALDNVRHRKLRSWLTIISILIGIMAIFALVSFGQGLSFYVDSLAIETGKDKLLIQAKGVGAPGTDENFFIPKEDIEFLSKVNGIQDITGLYMNILEVEHEKQKKYVFGMSLPMEPELLKLVMELSTVDVYKGRQLKKGDKLKVILGYNYQFENKIFKKALDLGEKIVINGQTVEIVGFFDSVGNPQDDSNIYLTEEGMLLLFPETEDRYQFAMARTEKTADATEVAERAEEKLRKFKGQDEGKEDFFIQTFAQAIEIFTNVITIINAILILIAFVSLIVAGVNIMNTMYTAVIERTKEIGIMKAVGAGNWDILFVFVFESGILGLIGGVLGVIVGFIVAKIGGAIALGYGYGLLQPIFPIWLIIGSLAFAFFVGALAGLLPARTASKLKPVDALRYE